ncbi:hypothetical protein V6N12_053474 [Hibiscus sabdariffa]|uniref:Secreted protein n=1 Tax=Hibiscus sabdariffa TaxID=183260 RepID=A0ABR2D7N3_9ROSI
MSRLQLHIVFCRSRMPASGGRISAFSTASHGLHLHMSLAASSHVACCNFRAAAFSHGTVACCNCRAESAFSHAPYS